jgi:hypothetical protein
MNEGMNFKKEVIVSQFAEDDTLEQDPEFSLEQVKLSINESLDKLDMLKVIPDSNFEKQEILRTLKNLTRQLRELTKVIEQKAKEQMN